MDRNITTRVPAVGRSDRGQMGRLRCRVPYRINAAIRTLIVRGCGTHSYQNEHCTQISRQRVDPKSRDMGLRVMETRILIYTMFSEGIRKKNRIVEI